ncbi:MAG: hypothetical protein ACUVTO_04205 [Candidatus Caldatribacteriaceae bacterium]
MVLKELLTFIEGELSALLGEEEDLQKDEEKAEEEREDFFELFVEALDTLKRREENTLKAPKVRQRTLVVQEENVERLGLENLLELYAFYLQGDTLRTIIPDREFERLLEERRKRILELCTGSVPLPMQYFFSDCSTRRVIIATFLVLLDLVFRNILFMQRGEGGEILLGRAEQKVPSESS